MDRNKKVAELMGIRKDWTIADYEEWEPEESIPWVAPILKARVSIPRSIAEWRQHMEHVLYHNYDINYIQECIDNEKM